MRRRLDPAAVDGDPAAPRSAPARKARSSDDLPEPATPWTTATQRAVVASSRRSAASSASRPTTAARRSASSAPSVRHRVRRGSGSGDLTNVVDDGLDRVGRQHQRLGVAAERLGAGRLVDAERAERPVVLADDVGADPADVAAEDRVDGREAVGGGGELLLRQPRAGAGNEVEVHRATLRAAPAPPVVAAAPRRAGARPHRAHRTLRKRSWNGRAPVRSARPILPLPRSQVQPPPRRPRHRRRPRRRALGAAGPPTPTPTRPSAASASRAGSRPVPRDRGAPRLRGRRRVVGQARGPSTTTAASS